MSGALITISGVDCSGKSTQMDLLQRALTNAGIDVSTRWFRPGYSAELDAVRRAVRAFRSDLLPPPGRSPARARTFARPSVQVLWASMALTDTLVQYAAKLRVELGRGRVILYDRYIYDASLDLELQCPSLPVEANLVAEMLQRVCPKPDLALLLTIPEEIVAARIAGKDEPFPDPDYVRALRRARYDEWSAVGSFTTVDASGSIAEVHDEVWARVEPVVNALGRGGADVHAQSKLA